MSDLIVKAAQYADFVHKGQMRKDGVTPYIVHPIRVAGQAMILGMSIEAIVTAWLHDALEDQPGRTYEPYLIATFGYDVVELIRALTNVYTVENYPDLIRKERKQKEVERLANIKKRPFSNFIDLRYIVHTLKFLDRIDNLEDFQSGDFSEGFKRVYVEESRVLLNGLQEANKDVAEKLEKVICENDF